MTSLPYALTYSRLLMAVFYIFIAIYKPLQKESLIAIILVCAILTDIFDGVIARKLGIVTDHLRQLDSKVDTVFWFSLFYLLIIMRTGFMREHAISLFVLLALEIGVQLYGFFKFNSSIALHTYSAKAWCLLLTTTVLLLLLRNDAEVMYRIMFIWGVISQAEVIAILLKLKTNKSDVKSIFSLS